MSKERELLNKAIEMIQIVPLMASIGHAAPDFGSELILEIQELLAQPETEQEPVAWMYEWVNEIGEHVKSVVYNFYDDANLIPLYTAPPKREPLSDEEIHKLSLENFKGLLSDRINFVRAIEKAHGIGGEM